VRIRQYTGIHLYFIVNANISPVELLIGYPSNLILVWKKRTSLHPRIFFLPMLFVLAGSIPGAFILKYITANIVKIIFGIVVIGIGIQMWFQQKGAKNEETFSPKKVSPLFTVIVGLSAGLLSGLFGVGALLAVYMTSVCEDNDAFKANISAVFAVESTFRICLYSALGLIRFETIRQAILLIPLMLLGLFLGLKSSDLMDEKLIRKIVILLLILSGIVLVAKSI
jgi:uncharacterized membrane protein YfcA